MATQDIQTSLYNGKYSVKFQSKAHRYYIDGQPKIGVTTILGKVLAKPQLMLWPLNMAIAYMREHIDYTETYTGRDIELLLESAYKAHSVRRDKGSDTGSIVHDLAEKRLQGHTFTIKEIADLPSEVALALGAFEGFMSKAKPKTIATEQIVYSPTLGYAGTYDSILEIDGKIYLVDLKTTNAGRSAPAGVYPENFLQLGAYAYAYEEQRLYEKGIGVTKLKELDDLMIISAKKDGKLHTKTASELGLSLLDCIVAWEHVVSVYYMLNGLDQKLATA
jgi:hypothetical protein